MVVEEKKHHTVSELLVAMGNDNRLLPGGFG